MWGCRCKVIPLLGPHRGRKTKQPHNYSLHERDGLQKVSKTLHMCKQVSVVGKSNCCPYHRAGRTQQARGPDQGRAHGVQRRHAAGGEASEGHAQRSRRRGVQPREQTAAAGHEHERTESRNTGDDTFVLPCTADDTTVVAKCAPRNVCETGHDNGLTEHIFTTANRKPV